MPQYDSKRFQCVAKMSHESKTLNTTGLYYGIILIIINVVFE